MSALTVGALLLSTNPAFAASNLPLGVDPTYQANGRVNAIVTIGDMVYVGGQFTAVRPAGAPANTAPANTALVTRQHLAAFDRISGIVRHRLAQVDAATGAVLPWAPTTDQQVNTIALTPGLIYFGGTFDAVNGQLRTRLAAVDYAGVLDPLAAAGRRPGADHHPGPGRALALRRRGLPVHQRRHCAEEPRPPDHGRRVTPAVEVPPGIPGARHRLPRLGAVRRR